MTLEAFQLSLREMATRLVRTFETLPEPETHMEVQRAARAWLAIEKMVRTLGPNEQSDTQAAAKREGDAAGDADEALQARIERRLDTLFESLRPQFQGRLDTVARDWWTRAVGAPPPSGVPDG